MWLDHRIAPLRVGQQCDLSRDGEAGVANMIKWTGIPGYYGLIAMAIGSLEISVSPEPENLSVKLYSSIGADT